MTRTGFLVATAAALVVAPSSTAFQPPPTTSAAAKCHVMTPSSSVGIPTISIIGRAIQPLTRMYGSANAGMATYEAMLQQAYSAQTSKRQGAMATAENELKQTTSALNAALDELKELRDLMGSTQQVQQVQTQQAEGQQLNLETTTGGALARPDAAQPQPQPQQQSQQYQEQPLPSQPPSTSSHLGTPQKQSGMRGGSRISPLPPPTPGTNIDIDRLGPGSRYLTPSQARRISKTETTRMEASEAFGRGSLGYYGRRYGVYGSPYGYGPCE